MPNCQLNGGPRGGVGSAKGLKGLRNCWILNYNSITGGELLGDQEF